jgi:hypothetical protein
MHKRFSVDFIFGWLKLPTTIPRIAHILLFEKNILHDNHFSGTVLMIQLLQNSPTYAYIGQNLLS